MDEAWRGGGLTKLAAVGLGQELWHAAIASAALLEHLAGRYGLAKDEAFLIGLLHDIGQLVVLKVVHEFSAKSKTKVTRPTFDQLSADWHEHLGTRLAGHWDLPDPLPRIIGHHHGEIASENPLATQLRLVELSDVVCSLLGYRPFEPCEFFELECVRELGLTDEPETHQLLLDVPELLDHATRVYA